MNVSKGGYCIELPGIVNRSYFFRGIGDTYVMLYFEILHLIAEWSTRESFRKIVQVADQLSVLLYLYLTYTHVFIRHACDKDVNIPGKNFKSGTVNVTEMF